MLSFFKRKGNNLEKQGGDSVISSHELLEGEQASDSNVEVKTELSFHPSWKIGPEERYYFQFLNNELANLKKNQLSLSGIELKKEEEVYIVSAFVRNSLSKSVKLQQLPLILIGANGEQLGRRVFDLSVLGDLPPNSSRPWNFIFEKQHLATEELPSTGWKLAFELKKNAQPHSLDLAETWQKSLAEGDKEKLAKLVSSMKPPKPGEVNFMGLECKQTDDGSLHVTLLIRNGSQKSISLQQLPLHVQDASGEVVAQGGFKLDDFGIKANTSKPWTFIFPKSLLLKEEIDLTTWKAYPPKG